MRWAAILGGVFALGASAGGALAALPSPPVPIPTLPVPTVPSLPTPSVPVAVPPPPSLAHGAPSLRAPTLSAPSAASTSSGVPYVSSAFSGAGGSSSSSTSSSAASAGSFGGGQPASRQRLTRLRSSRPWLSRSGPKAQRATTLTFRVARNGRVVFTVFEVSPACGTAGRFSVAAHAGLNRVRFNGRVHGRTLPVGTYQIRARRIGGGTVLHVVVVITDTPPSPAELSEARTANVCASTRTLSSLGRSSSGLLAAAVTKGGGNAPSEIVRNENSGTKSMTRPSGGGTPSAAGPFSPTRVSQNAANPLVIAAFAVAVLLLGLAALPQAAVPDPRLTHLLARHRVEVALAGAAALAAALLALALA